MIETALLEGKQVATEERPFIVGPLDHSASVETADVVFSRGGRQVHITSGASIPQSDSSNEILKLTQYELERHPSSPRRMINHALALLQRGDSEAARVLLEHVLEMQPENAVAMTYLGRALATNRELDAARSILQKAVELSPKNALARANLAQVLLEKGKNQEAEKLLSDSPSSISKLSIIAYYHGILRLRNGDPRGAITQLRVALRDDSRRPAIYHALGVAYSLIHDARRAERAFRTALALDPDSVSTVKALVQLYAENGKSLTAIEFLQDYLSYSSNAGAREMLAELLLEEGRFTHARVQLTRLLHEAPDDQTRSRVLNNLGVVHDKLQEHEKAMRLYWESIYMDSSNTTPLNNVARHLLFDEKYEDALSILQRAMEIRNEDLQKVVLYSYALGRTGDAEEAVSLLLPVAYQDRDRRAGSNAFAVLATFLGDELGRYAEACSTLYDAIVKYPNDLRLINDLAYSLLMTDRVSEAEAILRPATNALPDSVSLAVALKATFGLLSLKQRDEAGGLKGYQGALKLALKNHQTFLARAVKQKMHLELARYFLLIGHRERAIHEANRGLEVQGQTPYKRHLREFVDSLE